MASTRSSLSPSERAMERPELRHLQRMRQTRAEQVALMVQEHLRFVDQAAERRWNARCGRGRAGSRCAWARAPLDSAARGCGMDRRRRLAASRRFESNQAPALIKQALAAIITIAHQSQNASMTSRTNASGAARTAARPGPSITTKRISPASAFLSTRMSADSALRCLGRPVPGRAPAGRHVAPACANAPQNRHPPGPGASDSSAAMSMPTPTPSPCNQAP